MKATKHEADYRIGTPTNHCKLCTMFRPPHGCTSVLGKISPQGLCDYFERK